MTEPLALRSLLEKCREHQAAGMDAMSVNVGDALRLFEHLDVVERDLTALRRRCQLSEDRMSRDATLISRMAGALYDIAWAVQFPATQISDMKKPHNIRDLPAAVRKALSRS